MKRKNHLVWIDMEMTGLDPERDTIIEVATIITNSVLDVVALGPNLIIHQPDKIMKSMDAWNREHHKKSGLTQAVAESKLMMKGAEKQTLEFIKKYCYPNQSPLCGNSIHHDRRFIARHMPQLHKFLHYRMIDVSTIKELACRWYPTHDKLPKKSDNHRALEDIQNSIEELKYYRKNYFKKTLVPSTQAKA